MQNENAVSIYPSQTSGIGLKTIWHVNEDLSYNIFCENRKKSGYIALRTMEGEGRLHFNTGKIIEIKKDSFYVFPYLPLPRYLCVKPFWKFWWFEFQAADPQNLPLEEMMYIQQNLREAEDLESCFWLLKSNSDFSGSLAASKLESLIYQYANEWRKGEGKKHPRMEIMQKAALLMQQNLSGISMNQVAQSLFMSQRRLHQIFIKHAGKSPKAYYDELRLKTASDLLLHSSLSIKEVADRFGFSSEFHFSRSFKKLFGQPPSRHRG